MNSLKTLKWMKCSLLAAFVIVLASGLGNAQETVQAKGEFTLPFMAQWEGMTLAPGHYSFMLKRSMGDAPIVIVERGIRNLGVAQGYVTANRRLHGSSYMTAVRVGAAYRIASLQLGDPGVMITFFSPKHELLEASQTAQPARNVPVQVASK